MANDSELAAKKALADLTEELQGALDGRDVQLVDKIMSNLFLNYSEAYSPKVFRYNEECNIRAADWVKIKVNFPSVMAVMLFTRDEQFVRNLSEISEEEMELMNSLCW